MLTVEKLQILQSASFNCKDFRPDNASIPRLREIIFDSVEGCFCMCLFPQNITTRCDNSKIYCPQKSCQCNKKVTIVENSYSQILNNLLQFSRYLSQMEKPKNRLLLRKVQKLPLWNLWKIRLHPSLLLTRKK